MPRGFLVKRRSRRPAGVFRARPPAGPAAPRLEEAPRVPGPPEPPPPPLPELPPQQQPAWGPADSAAPAAAEPESRPEETPPPPPPPPPPAPPLRARPPPPTGRKPKAARRLSFADEVTTSPVLGLRIKAGPAGGGGGPAGGARAALLLGEFVCQLCKEPFGGPLALAQHRCSRIVRVEYRCPECRKSFSCPANLASHRRWHRPRPERAQHRAAPDSARPPRPAEGPAAASAAPPGELFRCPHCRKGFRRQAYLRKHLGTHPPPAFPCRACGAPFPTADLREQHQLWHALRDELLLPPPGAPERPDAAAAAAAAEEPLFACPHCAAAFLSSPGLARHASKCRPADGRPLLLLQVPLRPGC